MNPIDTIEGPTEQRALAMLKNVRAFFNDPENWIQGSFAQTVDGKDRCCVEGALNRQFGIHKGSGTQITYVMLDMIIAWINTETGWVTVTEWNDSPFTTHETVLIVLDRIIANQTTRLNTENVPTT